MDRTVLEHVLGALAAAEGTDPTDLDVVLQRHVSTDAIRYLTAHDSDAWRLQFETPNHVVEVMGDDTVLVDGERSDPAT